MTEIKYPVYKPRLGNLEKEYVNDCLDSTWISSKGKYIELFEKELASYCGVDEAICVSNGTVALHLAYLASGIGKGDEVIIPNFSYVATANAVLYCGAIPVFVDVHRKTWNINISEIENKITSKTKAIVFTDIYGLPAAADEISIIAKKHNLKIIEDAAESLGANYKGRKAGSIGDVSTLSFFGNKTITTGEGGAILTNNSSIAKQIRNLRNQGMSESRRYYHDILGFNYRMTNIQAAIGLAQMTAIDGVILKKRQIHEWYKRALVEYVEFQEEQIGVTSSYWMVAFLLKDDIDREKLIDFLAIEGIETRPFFYPMSEFDYFKSAHTPITNYISSHGLNVPSYPDLEESDVLWISDKIIRFIKTRT